MRSTPPAPIRSKFNVGTINPGSTQNVTGELSASTTGIPMTIVPHRTSAEVLTSLLRGDTQIGVESYAALKSPIDAGQIRAIAGVRQQALAACSRTCRRCAKAASTPRWTAGIRWWRRPARRSEIIDVLNGHVRAIIGDPDFQKRMIELGGEPIASIAGGTRRAAQIRHRHVGRRGQEGRP